MKSIERLESDEDRGSMAYRLFKGIAEYSMYDIEPDFSDNIALEAVWELMEREIDTSVGNRQRGFANDMMNEKYQSVIEAIVNNPTASLREIGELTGTNKDMVRRVRKKYPYLIQEAIDLAKNETSTLVSAVKEEIFIEGTYDTELFTKETMIEESVADNGTNNYVFGSDEEKSNISDDSDDLDEEECRRILRSGEFYVGNAEDNNFNVNSANASDSFGDSGLYTDVGDFIDTNNVTDNDSMRRDNATNWLATDDGDLPF